MNEIGMPSWVVIVLGVIVFAAWCNPPWVGSCFDDIMCLMKKLGIAPNYQSAFKDRPEQVVGRQAAISREFTSAGADSTFRGKVFLEGTHWEAVSSDPQIRNLKRDDKVKVVEHDGLTLKVVPGVDER